MKSDMIFNSFESLTVKQVLSYPLKNVLNPIFIKLEEKSLLAIQTLACMFKSKLQGRIRS